MLLALILEVRRAVATVILRPYTREPQLRLEVPMRSYFVGISSRSPYPEEETFGVGR